MDYVECIRSSFRSIEISRQIEENFISCVFFFFGPIDNGSQHVLQTPFLPSEVPVAPSFWVIDTVNPNGSKSKRTQISRTT